MNEDKRRSRSYVCPPGPPHLLIIRHQVRLKLPLGPILGQLVVGDLSQVKVGHLGGRSLHPPTGRPLRVGLPLGVLGLLFIALQGHLSKSVGLKYAHTLLYQSYLFITLYVTRITYLTIIYYYYIIWF